MTIMNLKLSMLTHTLFSLGRSSRVCMKVKIERELMTASLKFVGKNERKKVCGQNINQQTSTIKQP